MIRAIRHIGINLWLSILLFVPLVFWILPRLTKVFPDMNAVFVAALVFMVCFLVICSLIDFLARKMIVRLLVEGQTWEHSGIYKKAEKAYIRAIRVYDTLIFLPFVNRRVVQDLCAAIARFTASGRIQNPGFDLTTRIYLKKFPKDEDVAKYWLRRLKRKEEMSHADQSVLTLLAEQHYTNPGVNRLLADIFIRLERKDFTADKLFRYLAKTEPDLVQQYEGRIDALATEQEATLASMAGFEEPEATHPIRVREKLNFPQIASSGYHGLTGLFKKIISVTIATLGFIVRRGEKAIQFVKNSAKTRTVIKMAFLAIVFIWLGFFMVNTIAHLFKSKPVPEQIKEEVKAVAVPKPFTIQVAAYLKQVYADRYVDILKKKGIDASVKKVDGGGKSWYLVRVSEFEDKKTAEAYGNKLKQEKIIDDYFVNNK